MNRLRNRLIVVFLAATLVPLGVTLWLTANLFERSLTTYSSTAELERLSYALERTGQSFYQRARDDLKSLAASGKRKPVVYAAAQRETWPDPVNDFFLLNKTWDWDR